MTPARPASACSRSPAPERRAENSENSGGRDPGWPVTDANPIINDAFEKPTHRWEFGEGAPRVVEGRRAAGYIPPAPKGEQLRITDEVVRPDHVNLIRERVETWREQGYPGATPITKELLEHWFDPERELLLSSLRGEAVETIISLTEAGEWP